MKITYEKIISIILSLFGFSGLIGVSIFYSQADILKGISNEHCDLINYQLKYIPHIKEDKCPKILKNHQNGKGIPYNHKKTEGNCNMSLGKTYFEKLYLMLRIVQDKTFYHGSYEEMLHTRNEIINILSNWCLVDFDQHLITHENKMIQSIYSPLLVKLNSGDLVLFNRNFQEKLMNLQQIEGLFIEPFKAVEEIIFRHASDVEIRKKILVIQKNLLNLYQKVYSVLQNVYEIDKHGFYSKYIYKSKDFINRVGNYDYDPTCDLILNSYDNKYSTNNCKIFFENSFFRIIFTLKTKKNMTLSKAIQKLSKEQNYDLNVKILEIEKIMKIASMKFTADNPKDKYIEDILMQGYDAISLKDFVSKDVLDFKNPILMLMYGFGLCYSFEIEYDYEKDTLFIYGFNSFIFESVGKKI